jgi:hypothetical protein
MGLIYAITASFLLFIVLWALGIKQFDALLIGVGPMILAVAAWKVLSYFPNADTEVASSEN